MAERKKSSEFKPLAEVQGWRSSQVKCKEINFPLNINQPYTVRSFADFNKSSKIPDQILDNKKLPDLKKKSKSLQNKNFKYKGTDKNFKKLLVEDMSQREIGYYKSVKNKFENKNFEYLVNYENQADNEELGKNVKNSQRKYSDGELSLGKVYARKKIWGDACGFDEDRSSRFKYSNDDDNCCQKNEVFNADRGKNKPSIVLESIKDSESPEKKQLTLRTLETNSCFTKDPQLTPKLSKLDLQVPKQSEKIKTSLFIPNFDSISKPDPPKYPPIKFKKNFSELSETIQKTPVSDSAKSHRSLSLSKFTNEKEVQEYKAKDPITPNQPKLENKRWTDIQLTTIKEENFSQLAMKNRAFKQELKQEATPKHYAGPKISSKKVEYVYTKQRTEKKQVFSDIEVKPFSRDESPEDLITQLREKVKEIEKVEKKLVPEFENNLNGSSEKLTRKKSIAQKKPKKTVKKKREESIEKKKIYPELPTITISSEPVDEQIELVRKTGADRFIENYSISLISYINLCLVDFKGNLGSMFDKIDKSHKQLKKGFTNTEILRKYKSKIENKMIAELNSIIKKPEDQLTADDLKTLSNSLKSCHFSQGMKAEMILSIDSSINSGSYNTLKSSLLNIIERRLKWQTEYKDLLENMPLSDSHDYSDSESSSESSLIRVKPNSLSSFIEPSISFHIQNIFLNLNPPSLFKEEDIKASPSVTSKKEVDVSQASYTQNPTGIKEELQKITESDHHPGFYFSSKIHEFEDFDPELNEHFNEPADLENFKKNLSKRRFFSKDDTNTLINYKSDSPRLLMLEPDEPHPSELESEEVKNIIKRFRKAQHLKTTQKTFKPRRITRTFSNILKIHQEP